MDGRIEEIMNAFPGLKYDECFQITSPEDVDYNCIAWAFGRKDHWLWPDEDTDGVEVWPLQSNDCSLRAFVEAFQKEGYHACDNDEYEEGKEKVALYAFPDSQECTHASRQLSDGMWTSKLGTSYDIRHSTPYTIQGRIYGMVNCILSRTISK